jgi:hypothetical protein
VCVFIDAQCTVRELYAAARGAFCKAAVCGGVHRLTGRTPIIIKAKQIAPAMCRSNSSSSSSSSSE